MSYDSSKNEIVFVDMKRDYVGQHKVSIVITDQST